MGLYEFFQSGYDKTRDFCVYIQSLPSTWPLVSTGHPLMAFLLACSGMDKKLEDRLNFPLGESGQNLLKYR
jgi:hypothetical protein